MDRSPTLPSKARSTTDKGSIPLPSQRRDSVHRIKLRVGSHLPAEQEELSLPPFSPLVALKTRPLHQLRATMVHLPSSWDLRQPQIALRNLCLDDWLQGLRSVLANKGVDRAFFVLVAARVSITFPAARFGPLPFGISSLFHLTLPSNFSVISHYGVFFLSASPMPRHPRMHHPTTISTNLVLTILLFMNHTSSHHIFD